MNEAALESSNQWTDQACMAWIQDFEARRQARLGNDESHGKFMESQAGTFPREVVDFILHESKGKGGFLKARQEGRATYMPMGELARHLSGSEPIILPGVEVVDIDDPD